MATPAVALAAPAAPIQTQAINIPAQSLGAAIQALSEQTDAIVVATGVRLNGRRSAAVSGATSVEQALTALLRGTGLTWRRDANGAYAIVQHAPAQDAPVRRRETAPPAALTPIQQDDSLTAALGDIIVTARRREERIIDVPLSVSAFSQEQLEDLKIEGGAELLRAIPNVNFSKDNFTGYNFSIRGIGTKVLSATADPGVAISFNNTALLRNRLFEQEYFDVQRLEVLRGPQGTLYGRNANAGVVNMLPNLPELGEFSGEIQGELGNYDSQRARGYINIPLGDTLAVRFAGAMTKRDGFDYNTVTEQSVNGRDLWSSRIGVLWQPTESFRANFLWEHFSEDDDRSRTGKQLCTRGETPDTIDYRNANGAPATADVWTSWTRAKLTPGCQAESLFADEAFGVADSTGSPMVSGLLQINPFKAKGAYPDDYLTGEIIDPFNTGDGTQSKDLREIATNYDPVFRAKNDVFQLNLELDISDTLTLYSQSLYMKDSYYGSQDFLRSQPASGLFRKISGSTGVIPFFDMSRNPNGYEYRFGFNGDSDYGAIFCDPQLGCSDHAQAIDVSSSDSEQWSQEFRLQSSFEGPFNFNIGANYLKFKTEENYYIFSNLFTLIAMQANNNAIGGKTTEYRECGSEVAGGYNYQHNCMYIDPHPLDQIDGKGHNYFRSISLNQTESWAAFGEGYLNLRDDLRLTAGLRYTNDEKTVTPAPVQLLGGSGLFSGNQQYVGEETISKGFVYLPDQVQSWGEFTGRLALDWKPQLDFTDDTLVYASYARGYKAGGGNPTGQITDPNNPTFSPLPGAFAPEFLNAFEVGTKNSLLDGHMMLNATAFYYGYKDYQVSQILDRATYTETMDAHVFGLELESAWRPTANLRFDATLGYLNTTIAAGEQSIDVMNRTAGNDDWITVRPWATSPYTCIVPKDVIGRYIAVSNGPKLANPTAGQARGDGFTANSLCPGGIFSSGNPFSAGNEGKYGFTWDPVRDSRGGGRGFYTDLGGNALPNAPELTFNIGVQYRMTLPAGWDVTWRGDYYRQSESYARVYNSEYDRLKGWGNANLTVTVTRDGSPLTAQLYVKNLLDDTPITDAYTGPDELGNFANVFTLDPRIIGLSVRASF